MGAPYFTDKNLPPNEESILATLGRASRAWESLFERLHAEHPELSESWRYYADGKSWLLKVSHKAKTIFWLSVEQGSFRVGFHFADRLTEKLLASDLSAARKAEIRSSAPIGKLRPVSVSFGSQRGVRDVMTLISLKQSLK